MGPRASGVPCRTRPMSRSTLKAWDRSQRAKARVSKGQSGQAGAYIGLCFVGLFVELLNVLQNAIHALCHFGHGCGMHARSTGARHGVTGGRESEMSAHIAVPKHGRADLQHQHVLMRYDLDNICILEELFATANLFCVTSSREPSAEYNHVQRGAHSVWCPCGCYIELNTIAHPPSSVSCVRLGL